MTSEQIEALREILSIEENIISTRISCPLHSDNTPSADINFATNHFHCWGCGERCTLDDLVLKMFDDDLPDIFNNEAGPNEDVIIDGLFASQATYISESEFFYSLVNLQSKKVKGFVEIRKPLDPSFFHRRLIEFIEKRKIEKETYSLLHKVEIDQDIKSKTYGYIKFYINELVFNARLFIDELKYFGRPKYINSANIDKDFYNIENCVDGKDRILVEGIYDWLTLTQLGFENVICALGASIKEDLLFSLKQYQGTTFLLLDNDYSGVKAGNKIMTFASKYNINIISLELPNAKFQKCKDVSDCLMKNKEDDLKSWLLEQLDNFASNDIGYVENIITNPQPQIRSWKSGIESLDKILTGGFKPGLHAISATPGAGKTAFCIHLAKEFFVNQGARVLYASYEISRLQLWARLFSTYSNYNWVELEENPNLVELDKRDNVKNLAKGIRIIHNKDVNTLIKMFDIFDIVFIDYLQNMPNMFEDREKKFNVDYNLTRLNIACVEQNKTAIAINSLSKDNYGKDKLSFKDSGNIEYAVESAMILHKSDDFTIDGQIVKNRRGVFPAKFSLFAELAHCRFSDNTQSRME